MTRVSGGGEVPLEIKARPQSSSYLHRASLLPNFYDWASGEVTFTDLYSSAKLSISLSNTNVKSLVYLALDNISVRSGPC